MSGSGDGLPLPRRYWAVLALALGLAMAVLTGTLANLALPTIAREIHVSASEAIRVSNAYQLAVTMTLCCPLASLGEKLGLSPRLPLEPCCCSPRRPWRLHPGADLSATLVGARVLQGFGAAGVMSVDTALIPLHLPRPAISAAALATTP